MPTKVSVGGEGEGGTGNAGGDVNSPNTGDVLLPDGSTGLEYGGDNTANSAAVPGEGDTTTPTEITPPTQDSNVQDKNAPPEEVDKEKMMDIDDKEEEEEEEKEEEDEKTDEELKSDKANDDGDMDLDSKGHKENDDDDMDTKSDKEEDIQDDVTVPTTVTDGATKGSGTTVASDRTEASSTGKDVAKAMENMTFEELNTLALENSEGDPAKLKLIEAYKEHLARQMLKEKGRSISEEKDRRVDSPTEMEDDEEEDNEGKQDAVPQNDIHDRSDDSVQSTIGTRSTAAAAVHNTRVDTETTMSVVLVTNREFPILPSPNSVISHHLKPPIFTNRSKTAGDEERYWFSWQKKFPKVSRKLLNSIAFLEDKWNQRWNFNTVAFKLADKTLLMKDVARFRGSDWLNDAAINAAIAVMSSDAIPKEEGAYNKVLVFDTSFGQLVQEVNKKQGTKTYMYSKVKKMMITRMKSITRTTTKKGNVSATTSPLSPFDYEALLFPMNPGGPRGNHWQLIVVYPHRKTIEIMDSLFDRCGYYNAQLVFRWLMDHSFHDDTKVNDTKFSELFDIQKPDYGWTYLDNSESVQTQRNSDDCGLYVLCYIECFLNKYSIYSVDYFHVKNRRLYWKYKFSPPEFFEDGHEELYPGMNYPLPWATSLGRLKMKGKKLPTGYKAPRLDWYENSKNKPKCLILQEGQTKCYGCGQCKTCEQTMLDNILSTTTDEKGKESEKKDDKSDSDKKDKKSDSNQKQNDDQALFSSEDENDPNEDILDEFNLPTANKDDILSDDSEDKKRKAESSVSESSDSSVKPNTRSYKGRRKKKIRSPAEQAEYDRKLKEQKKKQKKKQKILDAKRKEEEKTRTYLGSDEEEEDDKPTNKYKRMTRKTGDNWKLNEYLTTYDKSLMELLLYTENLVKKKLYEDMAMDAKYFQARRIFIDRRKLKDEDDITEQDEEDWKRIKTWFYKANKKSLDKVVKDNEVEERKRREENAPIYKERFKRREAARKIYIRSYLDETEGNLKPGDRIPKENTKSLEKEFPIDDEEKDEILKQMKKNLESDDYDLFESYSHLMFVPGRNNNMTEHDPDKGPMIYWESEKDGKIVREYKTAYFRGSVLYRKENGKLARREDILNPAWVRYIFKKGFVDTLRLLPGQWYEIPIGSGRKLEKIMKDDEASIYLDGLLVAKDLKTNVVCEYQQNDNDYCLGYAVASAIKYMGYPEEAQWIVNEAPEWVEKPAREAIKLCATFIRENIPEMGNYRPYNKARTKGAIFKMTVTEFIARKDWKTLKIVRPVAEDGSMDHAIAVVDDIIFDARVNYALKLCEESLHIICGKGGMREIGWIFDFHEGYNTKKKLTRTAQKNWNY